MRYILPALPFLIVGAGKLIRLPNKKETQSYSRWRMGLRTNLVTALLFWAVVRSLRVYPHGMSYFNEIAGGPDNGHAHLVDSNID
jgi:hypothetical protein